MSVISAVKTYIEIYTDSVDDTIPVWVNYLKDEPTEYSIVPLGGSRKVTEWINGNSGEREFLFAFQSNRFTSDDIERIGSIELFEALADWFDEQSEAGVLPDLDPDEENPTGLEAFNIEALEYAYLFEQGESATGVYQIQCRLEFSKRKL